MVGMDLLDLGKLYTTSALPAIFTILLFLLGFLYFRMQNVPPGPWGLPYFGLWPFLKENQEHLELQNYMKKYGDVYSFRYAGKLFVHLGTLKSVKEVLVTKADCFKDRYLGFNVFNAFFKNGVLTANGEKWRVLRKFFVNAFREHGISSMKDYMSGPILDSVNATIDDLRAKKGEPFDIVRILSTRSCEILRRVIFNDDGMSEKELVDFSENYEKVLALFATNFNILHGEFAKYFIYPYTKGYKAALEGHQKAEFLLRKIVVRHEASFDEHCIRNIIDSYFKERNERRSKGDPTAQYFTEDALVASLLQFVGDGISAVAVFIGCIINDLLEFPEEQEKIYKELEEVVGPDRQPTLQDKPKLPYLNAFLQEVLRTMRFIDIFAFNECSKTTTINGRPIPKGAIVLLNFWSCHRDTSVFDEPDKFKPGRYITQPGLPKAETPLTFGLGKRSCVGEPFTMMQAFLFLSAVIKNFRLVRPEGIPKTVFPHADIQICALQRN